MLQDTDALRWSSFFGLRGFLSSISTSDSSRELILSSARSDDFFHPCRMLFLWSLHQWLWFVRSFHGYLPARPCGILYQWCQTFSVYQFIFAYWDPKFQMNKIFLHRKWVHCHMVQTVSGLNYVYKVPRIEHSHTAPRLFETQKFKFSTIYFQQDALNHY